jgi:hypothetical protein
MSMKCHLINFHQNPLTRSLLAFQPISSRSFVPFHIGFNLNTRREGHQKGNTFRRVKSFSRETVKKKLSQHGEFMRRKKAFV